MGPTVLIVDNNFSCRDTYTRWMTQLDAVSVEFIECAEGIDMALGLLKTQKFSHALVDMGLGASQTALDLVDGRRFASLLEDEGLSVLPMTGKGDYADLLREEGVTFLDKGMDRSVRREQLAAWLLLGRES